MLSPLHSYQLLMIRKKPTATCFFPQRYFQIIRVQLIKTRFDAYKLSGTCEASVLGRGINRGTFPAE